MQPLAKIKQFQSVLSYLFQLATRMLPRWLITLRWKASIQISLRYWTFKVRITWTLIKSPTSPFVGAKPLFSTASNHSHIKPATKSPTIKFLWVHCITSSKKPQKWLNFLKRNQMISYKASFLEKKKYVCFPLQF